MDLDVTVDSRAAGKGIGIALSLDSGVTAGCEEIVSMVFVSR